MMQSVKRLSAHIAALEARTRRAGEVEARREANGGQGANKERNPRAEPGRDGKTSVRGKSAIAGGDMKPLPVDEKDEAGPDSLEAYLFYLRQRAWPRDRIDPGVERRAVRHRDGMPAATVIGQHSAGGRGFIALQNVTTPLGLPNVDVNDLKAIPGTRYLNAATFGRGIWRIRLNTQVASLTLKPNPVVGGTAVIGTVTITDPAPPEGFPVSLGSDNTTIAAPAVPGLVIPVGKTSATFAVNTRMPINPNALTVNISATANNITRTAPLNVQNAPAPNLAFSVVFTRTASGIVANITIANNGTVAANSVQVNVGTLRNSAVGTSAGGSPIPLAFGNLMPGGASTQSLTFPSTAGKTGDCATLHLSGRYQRAAPTTDSGSFSANLRQNLP